MSTSYQTESEKLEYAKWSQTRNLDFLIISLVSKLNKVREIANTRRNNIVFAMLALESPVLGMIAYKSFQNPENVEFTTIVIAAVASVLSMYLANKLLPGNKGKEIRRLKSELSFVKELRDEMKTKNKQITPTEVFIVGNTARRYNVSVK